MGRYIHGDVEHKFWFGIQPSDVIETFGGQPSEIINWYYSEGELPVCEARLRDIWKMCMEITGHSPRYWLRKAVNGIDIANEDISKFRFAADFELGIKIRRAIKKYDSVSIEAEY